MMTTHVGNVAYEICEIPDPTGDLKLVLRIGGAVKATAAASSTILSDMELYLGCTRDEVANSLRSSLESWLRRNIETVTLTEPREDKDHPLVFRASYTYAYDDAVKTGVVWYDVNTATAGPDDLPAIVTNRMATAVARLLTPAGGVARAMLDRPE